MTRERFEEIFDQDNTTWEGDNAFQGLQIIAKYFDLKKVDILTGATHDEIFSVDVDKIIDAGITEEDSISLRNFNWMIDSEYDSLACFV